MSLEAGNYRRRITIQQSVDTPNGSGGMTRTWTTVSGCSSVPASITYPPPSKKGDEVYSQQQKRSGLFATIKMRFRPSQNIDASMRVLYGSRTFEIRTVFLVEEARQEITLQCEELQSSGVLH